MIQTPSCGAQGTQELGCGVKQTARRRRGKDGMPVGERELTDSAGVTRPASIAPWEGHGGPAA